LLFILIIWFLILSLQKLNEWQSRFLHRWLNLWLWPPSTAFGGRPFSNVYEEQNNLSLFIPNTSFFTDHIFFSSQMSRRSFSKLAYRILSLWFLMQSFSHTRQGRGSLHYRRLSLCNLNAMITRCLLKLSSWQVCFLFLFIKLIILSFLLFIRSIKLRIINKYTILNRFYCYSNIMTLEMVMIKIKNVDTRTWTLILIKTNWLILLSFKSIVYI